MQKHQEPDQLNALNLDVGKRVLKRVDGLSGEWHAATVTSIAFDQANNEKTYTLQFDHDGGAEILGAVAMRKLLLDLRLKEMTMQRYLETNPGPLSDEEDILGQDMFAYMAQHTQKLAAESDAVLSNTHNLRPLKNGKLSQIRNLLSNVQIGLAKRIMQSVFNCTS